MSLIVGENLGLSFGARTIFENLSFQVAKKDRVGLVGRNGSGKTTLLRMMAGEINPHAGSIRITRGVKLGYLPQDVTDAPVGALLASVLSSVPGKIEVEESIGRTEDALSASNDPDEQVELADRLSELLSIKEHFDTVYAAHKAEEILHGLGFSTKRFDDPLAELSGGWRTRAALASLLYQRPDVLLMDEPTNHLDVDTVRWLSQYLAAYDRSLVLVCHDREFLNRQIARVISFESEGVRQYRGDYESYVAQRSEEEKVLERRVKNQEQKAKDAIKFVEKFRYKATKARQAQSKLKLLQKMEIIETFQPLKTIRFSFPQVPPSGRIVFRLEKLSKSFGENVLYRNVTLHVERGDRIAIIGPNGVGKTTLLKIMAGELAAGQGSAATGHGVTLSYYAQHQAEHLDQRKSVVEEVGTAAPDANQSTIRGILGAFLFSGDEVDKLVGVLSGGEKARVALAKLLVRPGNCLLMDEPTNHLDIFAAEKLIEALAGYGGTLVFVSHNQAFVNKLATKVWDIRDGGIVEYPGNLTEYFAHLDSLGEAREAGPQGARNGKAAKSAEKAADAPAKAPQAAAPERPAPAASKAEAEAARRDASRAEEKARKREEAQARQRLSKVVSPLKSRIANAEKKIARLEEREKVITEALSDPDIFADPEKSRALLSEYDEVRREAARLLARWEKDHARLEEIMKSGAA